MNGQVLFLTTFYYPTIQELDRLENIQREISGWRAELAREWQLKRFTPGEIYLSKMNFHKGIRRHWRIYKGFREEITKQLLIESKV